MIKNISFLLIFYLYYIPIWAQNNPLKNISSKDTLIDKLYNPIKDSFPISKLLSEVAELRDSIVIYKNTIPLHNFIEHFNSYLETDIFNFARYLKLSNFSYFEDISHLVSASEKVYFEHPIQFFEIVFQPKDIEKVVIVLKNQKKAFHALPYDTDFDFFSKKDKIYLIMTIVPDKKIYIPLVKKLEDYLK